MEENTRGEPVAQTNQRRQNKANHYTLTLEIDVLPKSYNQLMSKHWRVRHKESVYWKKLIAYLTLGKRPVKILTKAKLNLTRHSSACPDPDGLVSTFKYIIDGLVNCGVLEDDNFGVIGMPSYNWVKSKRKDQKITILVEEIL